MDMAVNQLLVEEPAERALVINNYHIDETPIVLASTMVDIKKILMLDLIRVLSLGGVVSKVFESTDATMALAPLIFSCFAIYVSDYQKKYTSVFYDDDSFTKNWLWVHQKIPVFLASLFPAKPLQNLGTGA